MDYSDMIYISEELGNSLSRTQVSAGDIVISQRGSLGQCAIVDNQFEKLNISANIIAIKNIKHSSATFIRDYICSVVGQTLLERNISGQVQQKVTTQDIADLLIPIGCDEARLSDIMETAYVSYQQKLKQATEEYQQAIERFERETALFDFSSVDNKLFFSIHLKDIKGKRFDVKNVFYCQSIATKKIINSTLGSLTIDEPCYGTSATAIERTSAEQPKYIRITDFDDFGIKENHTYMTADTYAEKHFLKRNDILFARSGSIGRTYFYDGSIGSAIFAGYCIRFRFDESKVIPKYAYWCTKTNYYRNWVKGICRSAVQPNINKEEYKSFEITLPCLERQRALVDFMDKTFLSYRQTIKQAESEWQSAKEQFEKELLK